MDIHACNHAQEKWLQGTDVFSSLYLVVNIRVIKCGFLMIDY